MNRINKKGFTMIEVLVVVAIMAILALVVIPGVMKYISQGKDSYNDRLAKQLLVSGKNYFAEKQELLPVKSYLDVSVEKHSFVGVITMQSENYISKDFVDSEGRNCKNSFVFVNKPIGNVKNEWHACLICEDDNGNVKNYSEKDDKYCVISNWDDNKNPTCSASVESSIVSNDITYNPKNLYVSDITDDYTSSDGSIISQIWIYNSNVSAPKVIDVSKKERSIIERLNIVNYFFKDKDGKLIDGEYSIYVRDFGGNFSSKCNKRIIVDQTPPSCDLNLIQNTGKKYLKLEGKDKNIDSSIRTYISKNSAYDYDSLTNNNPITKDVDTDGMYYGYVADDVGNWKRCENNVKIKMFSGEKPYCYKTSGDYTYVKRSGSIKYVAECYITGGETNPIDTSKISLLKPLGTVSASKNSSLNYNKDNKIVVNINFKASNNGDGNENISLLEGFVKSEELVNDALSIDDFYVDTTLPSMSLVADKSKTSGGWYKSPIKVTASCSDKGSGVSSMAFANKTSKSSITVERKKAAKPIKYSSSCSDKAGNSNSISKNFYVRVYTCNTSKCGNHCTKYSTGYNYYWAKKVKRGKSAGIGKPCSSKCTATLYKNLGTFKWCTCKSDMECLCARSAYSYCSKKACNSCWHY